MFSFLKKRRQKRERAAEVKQLGLDFADEINAALDEWFAKVEEASQKFLERLKEQVTDLTPIEGETPREMSEVYLLENVEDWREVRPTMEASGREFLSQEFEVSREMGVDWRLEEVFAEKFNTAEFNFIARAVIVAGEAASAAEAA